MHILRGKYCSAVYQLIEIQSTKFNTASWNGPAISKTGMFHVVFMRKLHLINVLFFILNLKLCVTRQSSEDKRRFYFTHGIFAIILRSFFDLKWLQRRAKMNRMDLRAFEVLETQSKNHTCHCSGSLILHVVIKSIQTAHFNHRWGLGCPHPHPLVRSMCFFFFFYFAVLPWVHSMHGTLSVLKSHSHR